MPAILASERESEYAGEMTAGRIPDFGTTLEEDEPPAAASRVPPTDGQAQKRPDALAAPLTQESPHAEPPPQNSDLALVARAQYQFGKEVARGGLGRILRARDLRLDRVVAIKELIHETPSTRARFEREIAITVRLQHPNIVAIHEAGQWPDGRLFYAMNFLVGGTLQEAIAKTRNLDERLGLVANVIAIADAVAFAHDQGVIHRDLKPANVLVGRFGETVLIDWGLAKYAEGADVSDDSHDTPPRARRGVTAEGGVVGTAPYMPPEQARGEAASKRADVYSLGAILYQTLSNTEPYREYIGEKLLERIGTGPPAALSDLEPELAPDLLAIVEKAMARAPERRYANAGEMADELRRFAAGRLVGAYVYKPWDLARRFVMRHSATFATAAIALMLLVVLAVSLVRRIREQRDLAEFNAAVAIRERDVATARSQALLVSQAKVQAESDPTEAVAMLKGLDGHPQGALSVAARAEELGVARRVLTAHTDRILCLAYSPDGSRILSGSSDQTLRLWNTMTGVSQLIRAHSDQVTSCVFTTDGRSFASAGYDSRIFLHNTENLTQIALPNHSGPVKAIAFSDDGTQLVSAADDNTIRFWDLGTLTFDREKVPNARWPQLTFSQGALPLVTAPHADRSRVWFGAGRFRESPGDVRVRAAAALPAAAPAKSLLGLDDGRVVYWDFGQSVTTALDVHAAVAHVVTQEAGGPVVAIANVEGEVYRFDWRTRETLKVAKHDQRIETLAISMDGRFIASGGWDKSVRVHDAVTLNTRVLRGHADVVSVLKFSPDGAELASASWDKHIRLWPIRGALHDQRRVLGRHEGGAHTARFSQDGRLVASGGHDNIVRLYDIEQAQTLELRGHNDHVYRVAFSPTGRQLASSSDDRTVRIWNVPTEKHWTAAVGRKTSSSAVVLTGHEADVEEITFSPDGKQLASASEDKTARLWNLETRTAKLLYHDHDITQVVFDGSGAKLASSSRAGEVRLFANNGDPLKIYREHNGEVHGLAFSPDNNWLASSDIDGGIRVRETGGTALASLNGLIGARQISFSANGKWLGVAGAPPHLWLCSFAAHALAIDRCRDFSEHRSAAHTIAFSPDSKQLASAGGDGQLYLWDVESQEHRSYRGHLAPVFDLRFSPDGRSLLSASSDETVRLWPRIRAQSPNTLADILRQLTEESDASAEPRDQ